MATLPRHPAKRLAHFLLLGITISACGGGGDGNGGGTPPPTTAIAKDAAASGDAQTGLVGQALSQPIRVLVTEDGTPLSGATVAWSTTATGGSLTASSITDAAGIASNTWTLGTVSGPQTAQAALTGASGSPVTFNATATADVAAALSKLSGDNQQGPVSTALLSPLVAKVSDQYGNGVPGVAVGWAASAGTVSNSSIVTDAGGNSAVQVTLGPTEGPITITASADGLTGSPQTFTATAQAAGPSGATVNVVNNSFQPSTLTVDAGTTVTWRWGTGAVNHNVMPTGTEPPGSGPPSSAPDSYQHTFNTPGTYNYFCEVHQGVGMEGTITVQ
jgi:plastocyanin